MGHKLAIDLAAVQERNARRRGLWLDKLYAKSYLKDEISLSYESHLEISTIHN